MRSKWPDFLFEIAVRLACGAVLGAIAGFLICAPIRGYAARHPLLLWVFGDKDHPGRPYYWFGAWSLGGAILAMLTTPRWQTPWYRRDTTDLNLWVEGDQPGQSQEQSGSGSVKESVSIRTVSADGERHEYASMEEVPPEIRSEIEGLEKEAAQARGSESSDAEISQTGDAITAKITRRKNVSVYKIVDESGAERIYHSLEEMPPEIRAAIAQAEEKPEG